jgi:hypothetical protein
MLQLRGWLGTDVVALVRDVHVDLARAAADGVPLVRRALRVAVSLRIRRAAAAAVARATHLIVKVGHPLDAAEVDVADAHHIVSLPVLGVCVARAASAATGAGPVARAQVALQRDLRVARHIAMRRQGPRSVREGQTHGSQEAARACPARRRVRACSLRRASSPSLGTRGSDVRRRRPDSLPARRTVASAPCATSDCPPRPASRLTSAPCTTTSGPADHRPWRR